MSYNFINKITDPNYMSRYDPLFRTHMQEIFTEITDYADTKANKTQEVSIPATLLNGWTNFGAYEDVGYFKDTLGLIHIKGLANCGTKTLGTIVFTLPIGYRAAKTIPLIGTTSGGTIGYCSIQTDGTITCTGISGTYFSFDTIPAFKGV